ncbi:hypothetical protein [Trichlorobacter ammonificans]|uniref:BarA sensory histidine kinase (= VarS = GacS) n=1 Tax=Trichlorobacter ammonificans TaxID=2916410 RepID=A0ABM9DA59_9BACT|nr:hypothetical protein [Trichlorobacter ammonificans]CAH2032083.1 BarA sensory histidine kinase (= VarS = GacS) [Trichlorobacter ammonificans]
MRTIRREEEATGGHIPVVVLTADIMRHAQADMLAAGCDGYLKNPVQRRTLAEEIRRVVG